MLHIEQDYRYAVVSWLARGSVRSNSVSRARGIVQINCSDTKLPLLTYMLEHSVLMQRRLRFNLEKYNFGGK